MSNRSVWKGPFVHPSLLKKIDKLISKKIEIKYKDQTSFLDLKPRNLDLAVYLN